MRVFSEDAWYGWKEVDGTVEMLEEPLDQVTTGKEKRKVKRGPMTKLPPPPHPLPPETDVTLDLGGVDGRTQRRRESTRGVVSRVGPIEVEDEAFRGNVWRKWAGEEDRIGMRDILAGNQESRKCAICKGEIDIDVSSLTRHRSWWDCNSRILFLCLFFFWVFRRNISSSLLATSHPASLHHVTPSLIYLVSLNTSFHTKDLQVITLISYLDPGPVHHATTPRSGGRSFAGLMLAETTQRPNWKDERKMMRKLRPS